MSKPVNVSLVFWRFLARNFTFSPLNRFSFLWIYDFHREVINFSFIPIYSEYLLKNWYWDKPRNIWQLNRNERFFHVEKEKKKTNEEFLCLFPRKLFQFIGMFNIFCEDVFDISNCLLVLQFVFIGNRNQWFSVDRSISNSDEEEKSSLSKRNSSRNVSRNNSTSDNMAFLFPNSLLFVKYQWKNSNHRRFFSSIGHIFSFTRDG